jgi:hypothetical protein
MHVRVNPYRIYPHVQPLVHYTLKLVCTHLESLTSMKEQL